MRLISNLCLLTVLALGGCESAATALADSTPADGADDEDVPGEADSVSSEEDAPGPTAPDVPDEPPTPGDMDQDGIPDFETNKHAFKKLIRSKPMFED